MPPQLQLSLLNVPPAMDAIAALPRPQHVILNHIYLQARRGCSWVPAGCACWLCLLAVPAGCLLGRAGRLPASAMRLGRAPAERPPDPVSPPTSPMPARSA